LVIKNKVTIWGMFLSKGISKFWVFIFGNSFLSPQPDLSHSLSCYSTRGFLQSISSSSGHLRPQNLSHFLHLFKLFKSILVLIINFQCKKRIYERKNPKTMRNYHHHWRHSGQIDRQGLLGFDALNKANPM
jgi:hypothetical protein